MSYTIKKITTMFILLSTFQLSLLAQDINVGSFLKTPNNLTISNVTVKADEKTNNINIGSHGTVVGNVIISGVNITSDRNSSTNIGCNLYVGPKDPDHEGKTHKEIMEMEKNKALAKIARTKFDRTETSYIGTFSSNNSNISPSNIFKLSTFERSTDNPNIAAITFEQNNNYKTEGSNIYNYNMQKKGLTISVENINNYNSQCHKYLLLYKKNDIQSNDISYCIFCPTSLINIQKQPLSQQSTSSNNNVRNQKGIYRNTIIKNNIPVYDLIDIKHFETYSIIEHSGSDDEIRISIDDRTKKPFTGFLGVYDGGSDSPNFYIKGDFPAYNPEVISNDDKTCTKKSQPQEETQSKKKLY
ncbi:MAG TPA: hypothetical protein VLB80_00205 [Candidatus Babeliales bacterium]|nr:hypothetical protein [Candidatus Babeliales bacterium]